jgi:hypothetical protein
VAQVELELVLVHSAETAVAEGWRLDPREHTRSGLGSERTSLVQKVG